MASTKAKIVARRLPMWTGQVLRSWRSRPWGALWSVVWSTAHTATARTSTWSGAVLESVRVLPLRRLFLVGCFVATAGAAGAVLVVAVDWPLITGPELRAPAFRASVAAKTEAVTSVTPSLPQAAATPARVVVVPTASVLGVSRSPTPAPTPAPEPASPAAPTADDAWNALVPELDALWGRQTPAVIDDLDQFLTHFPEYQPATEKLYAALVGRAAELVAQDSAVDAADQLQRALALQPDRSEAGAALLALTPTPTAAADATETLAAPADDTSPSEP